jgi:PadR family transcriptional regulator PadR
VLRLRATSPRRSALSWRRNPSHVIAHGAEQSGDEILEVVGLKRLERRILGTSSERLDWRQARLILSIVSKTSTHMPRYDTMQGALPLVVLKILARRGPLHGYAITAQIETMSENVLHVEQGSLYPALHRMEESGWVKARWVRTENNRRARIYEVSAAGRRQLDAEQERWQAVTDAVGHILKHA